MIDAQLGPPVAVVSRGGSAPTGGPADIAPAAHPEAEQGSFDAALESRQSPPSSDARPAAQAHTDTDAAGPPTGELQEEDAADAGASQEQAAAAGIAAAIASVVSAVIPVAASPTPPSGALAGAPQAEVVQAAPPQPIAGLVPAALDGKGGVVPATTTAQVQAQAMMAGVVTGAPAAPAAPTATTATATATTATATPATATMAAAGASISATGPDAAPAAGGAPAGSSAAPAATLTLTITPTPHKDAAAGAVDAAPQAPVVTAPTTTTVVADAKAPAAPAPQAVAQEPARPASVTTEPPAGAVAPAPAQQPTHSDPLGGIVRPSGGLTTPHELAREVGQRVHMAVREGGRELVVNLRPAELGHLTIRVTMHDGVMQASIIADRPEAARMLQQSMEHLDSALGDLGYSLDNLDVAYSGQDPRDAQSSSKGNDSPVSGEVLEADGTPAVPGPTTTPASASSSRLDILA